MKNILITGGPVHGHLDDVKIITNRFRGGLMCQLAMHLVGYDTRITYLCSPMAGAELPLRSNRIEVVTHKGFLDYRERVLSLAPHMDAVVLGASVLDLIPAKPWGGKFPSHNYKPGDTVPIDFVVTPRVIDDVKKAAPNTQLFGYKLLSGESHEELVRAAYGLLLETGAAAVLANDDKAPRQKFTVTKERGVHPMTQDHLADWIWDMLTDEYYSTVIMNDSGAPDAETRTLKRLINQYRDKFVSVETDYIFGTVAVRVGDEGFLTTGRGKRELDDIVQVTRVDDVRRTVYAEGAKASLNAPLLAHLFRNPQVDYIVHYHEQVEGLHTYEYAPPGTARDSDRFNFTSFNIREHGCMLLFDKEGNQV